MGRCAAASRRVRGDSFAVPLAFAFVFANRANLEEMQALATLLAFALIAVSAGHAVVRGFGVARVCAAHTAIVLTIGLFAKQSASALLVLAVIGLVGMGVTIPFGWMKLRTWRDDETRL